MRAARFIVAALARALRNLVEQRRMHALALTVMALSLSVLGVFLVIAGNLAQVRAQVSGEARLSVFIAAGIDAAGQARLAETARALPGAREVELLSAEQTAARFREALGSQGAVLDGLGEEVIPAALLVTAAPETPPDEVERLAAALGRLIGVEEVVFALEELQRLSAVIRIVELAALLVGGLIALVTVIIISNTIRLTVMARREEIAILKLVGATDAYVRFPFVLEGLFGGLLAGTLAALLVGAANAALVEALRVLAVGGLDLTSLATLEPRHAIALVILGGLLGLLGGLISVGRFLRVS